MNVMNPCFFKSGRSRMALFWGCRMLDLIPSVPVALAQLHQDVEDVDEDVDLSGF